MRSDLFITGTDTEVGKTLAACALTQGFREKGEKVLGMKPIAAGQNANGHNEDVLQLRAAGSFLAPLEEHSPYCFKAAMAPHLAALAEGGVIERTHILRAFEHLKVRADRVIVEGAGGFRIPLGFENGQPWDSADLAVSFGCPVILVVGLRLGCLNHALLTAEAIQSRGLSLAGWIGNTLNPEMPGLTENIQTLTRLLPCPVLGILPHLENPEDALTASRALNLSALLT